MSDPGLREHSLVDLQSSETPHTAAEFQAYWANRFHGYGSLPPNDYPANDLFGYLKTEHLERVGKMSNLLVGSVNDRQVFEFKPHGNVRTPLEELRVLEESYPLEFFQAVAGISQMKLDEASLWKIARTAEEAHLGTALVYDMGLHAPINAACSYVYEMAMQKTYPYVFQIADRFLTTETGKPITDRFSAFDLSDYYRETLNDAKILNYQEDLPGEVYVIGSIKTAHSLMRRVVFEPDVLASIHTTAKHLKKSDLQKQHPMLILNELVDQALSGYLNSDGYGQVKELIQLIESKMGKRNDTVRGRVFCISVRASEMMIERVLAAQQVLRKNVQLGQDIRLDSMILDVEDQPGRTQERNIVHPLGIADSSLRPFGPTITKLMLDRLMTRKGDVSMWLAFHGYFPARLSNGLIRIIDTNTVLGTIGLEIQVIPPGLWLVNDAHRQKFIGVDFDNDFERWEGVYTMRLLRAIQFAKNALSQSS